MVSRVLAGLLLTAAAELGAQPATAPPPVLRPQAPRMLPEKIPQRMLGTLYATDTFYTLKYILTLQAVRDQVEGEMRVYEGDVKDDRTLYNIRLVKEEGATLLVGDFSAVYDNPRHYCTPCDPKVTRRNGTMRGSFRARFFGSSADSYSIEFIESDDSEIEPGYGTAVSFHRTP